MLNFIIKKYVLNDGVLFLDELRLQIEITLRLSDRRIEDTANVVRLLKFEGFFHNEVYPLAVVIRWSGKDQQEHYSVCTEKYGDISDYVRNHRSVGPRQTSLFVG